MLTQEQLIERQNYIGGSDIGIIFGLSSYKTAYQLYLEKIGAVALSIEQTEAQLWGSMLEPVIRSEFMRRNNVTVTMPDLLTHPEYYFLKGNLDGFIEETNTVLEIKCASGFIASQWGEPGTSQMPLTYLLQVAHYCLVANADRAIVCVLMGGNDYREYIYTRDASLEERIIREATRFWDCVMTRTPPKAINIDDLRLMYSIPEPKTVVIEENLFHDYHALLQVKSQIKALNDEEERIKFNLMSHMQSAEHLVDHNNSVLASWKANKRGTRTFLLKAVGE